MWLYSARSSLEQYFDADGDLNVNAFTSADFEQFLLAKVNDPAKQLCARTLSGFRSAVKDVYRRKRIPLPTAYDEDFKSLFTEKLQKGGSKDSGKQPLTYSLYMQLCAATLASGDGGFGHLFLITQWNLMCRSKSVETVYLDHLVCMDDSVGIMQHHTKTNQEGTRPKDPRHVYGNPIAPETCWLTALGLYLACNPLLKYGPVFPGSNQRSRYCKILSRVLAQHSQSSSDFGSHSVRKGLATYEAAGDQVLDRVVASLDLKRSDFAALPPHFRDVNSNTVHAAMVCMFPTISAVTQVQSVLKLSLASLVYHSIFLVNSLPKSHALRATHIFREPSVMEEFLQKKIAPPLDHWFVFLDAPDWHTTTCFLAPAATSDTGCGERVAIATLGGNVQVVGRKGSQCGTHHTASVGMNNPWCSCGRRHQ
ncbi:TPA: hypothetical protein N0F65_011188 [Lagenidium giganteum]|uniref:Uncharacterized protein n=1 Tax=Lagenidium giganteum TaxID=4803 RepID=A0AAV2Z718_9STRA|nr:TPA: hypothetical protein N0F65_011188 [Lagenidium giganteum]